MRGRRIGYLTLAVFAFLVSLYYGVRVPRVYAESTATGVPPTALAVGAVATLVGVLAANRYAQTRGFGLRLSHFFSLACSLRSRSPAPQHLAAFALVLSLVAVSGAGLSGVAAQETEWTHNHHGTNVVASTSGDDDRIYSGDNTGTIIAANKSDGSLDWQTSPASDTIGGMDVDKTTVYLSSNDGSVYALDKQDGSLKWSHSYHSAKVTGVVVDDGVVFSSASTSPGEVYAVDSSNGESLVKQATKWKYTDSNGNEKTTTSESVVSSNSSSYEFTKYEVSGKVTKFKTGSGSGEATATEFGKNTTLYSGVATAEAISVGSNLYVGDDKLASVSLNDGSEEWTNDVPPSEILQMDISSDGDTLYATTSDSGDDVFAFSASGGSTVWSREAHPSETANGIDYNSKSKIAYTVGFDQRVVGSQDGSEVYSHSKHSSNTVSVHADVGTVYTGDGNGVMYAVGTEIKEQSSPPHKVVDQNDNPVSDISVEIIGINSSASNDYNSDTELVNDITDFKPDDWDPDFDPAGAAEDYSANYPVVHTPEAWENPNLVEFQMDEPLLVAPAEEEIFMSIWDPSQTDSITEIDDRIETSLPGKPADGTIVVEELHYDGSAEQEVEVDTDETHTERVGFVGSEDHPYASFAFKPGFYRLSPKSSDISYVIAAGSPDEIASQAQEDVQGSVDRGVPRSITNDTTAVDGTLTNYSGDVDSLFQNDALERAHTTTGVNGTFEIVMPDYIDQVAIQTVSKQPFEEYTNIDQPSVDDLDKLREAGYNGSVYVQSAPEIYNMSSANPATVKVHEVSTFGEDNLSDIKERIDEIEERLGNITLPEFPGCTWVPNSSAANCEEFTNGTGNLTPPEIDLCEWAHEGAVDCNSSDIGEGGEIPEEVRNRLDDIIDDNQDLRDRIDEILADIEDPTEGDRIGAILQAINDLQNSLETGPPTSGTTGNNISATFPFDIGLTDDELSKDDILVTARLSNGATRVLDTDEFELEENALGSTNVVIEDYQLPKDVASAMFEVHAVTDEGNGKSTQRVLNPRSDLTPPELSAFDFSSTVPGPSETVRMKARGTEITNISVTGPEGANPNAVLTSDGARFVTDGAGLYRVEPELDGDWTETVEIRATSENLNPDPSVRVTEGPIGQYAVAGEGFRDAEVSSGENSMDIEATANGDAPRNADINIEEVAKSADANINVELLNEDGTTLSRHVNTRIRTNAIPSDALIYRGEDQPLPVGEETSAGTTEDKGNAAIIDTYSDGQGSVNVRVVPNPSIFESVAWDIRTNVPFNVPITLGGFLMTLSGLVAGGRRWSG